MATKELEQRLQAQDLLLLVEKHRCNESRENLLRRFLTARDNDVEKAFSFLKSDLEWREQQHVLKYHSLTSSKVLGVNGDVSGKTMLDSMFAIGYLGKDYQGRPVVYRKITPQLDAVKLTTETNMTYEKFIEYNIWLLERMAKTMSDEGQWVTILDLSELRFGHITKMHLNWVKVLADLLKDHYPERLGKNMIINAPTVFSAAWTIAKTWLDERTKQKISIYTSEKSWRAEAEKMFDLSLLPEHLGGLTNLSFDPHSLDPDQSTPLAATAAAEGKREVDAN